MINIEELTTTSPGAFGVNASFSGRRWMLRDADDETVRNLARSANISGVLARVLASRGVQQDEIADLISIRR